jgi:hypothetical protein
MVWMDNSSLWAGCGEGFAVGLVRVWWFVVVRSVGFLLASVSAFTSKRPRPRPTTPQVDVILKKLMPFPELEALAAQSLLTAVVAVADLPGLGPGAKPTVMAPKGQVRSLVDNHLRGINNSATAPTLKAEAIARGLKVPAGNKAAVLTFLTRTDGGVFTPEDWSELPFNNEHMDDDITDARGGALLTMIGAHDIFKACLAAANDALADGGEVGIQTLRLVAQIARLTPAPQAPQQQADAAAGGEDHAAPGPAGAGFGPAPGGFVPPAGGAPGHGPAPAEGVRHPQCPAPAAGAGFDVEGFADVIKEQMASLEHRLITASQAKSTEQAAIHAAALSKLQMSTDEAQAAATASAEGITAFMESQLANVSPQQRPIARQQLEQLREMQGLKEAARLMGPVVGANDVGLKKLQTVIDSKQQQAQDIQKLLMSNNPETDAKIFEEIQRNKGESSEMSSRWSTAGDQLVKRLKASHALAMDGKTKFGASTITPSVITGAQQHPGFVWGGPPPPLGAAQRFAQAFRQPMTTQPGALIPQRQQFQQPASPGAGPPLQPGTLMLQDRNGGPPRRPYGPNRIAMGDDLNNPTFFTLPGGQVRIISGDGSRLVNMRGGRDNLDSAMRSASVGGNMPNIGPCFYCNDPHGQFECPLLRRMKAQGRIDADGHPSAAQGPPRPL